MAGLSFIFGADGIGERRSYSSAGSKDKIVEKIYGSHLSISKGYINHKINKIDIIFLVDLVSL
jgi:hypothetical protein